MNKFTVLDFRGPNSEFRDWLNFTDNEPNYNSSFLVLNRETTIEALGCIAWFQLP